MLQLLTLCVFAFLAGFIDSVVGGGGLIQIPALFIFFPNATVPLILGTNKVSSIAGTSAAALRFSRELKFNKLIIIASTATAFIFSFLGARFVNYLSDNLGRLIILVLLIVVFIYTFFKKDFGSQFSLKKENIKSVLYAAVIGAAIGFYDGFLGAGTGSFLIFAFIEILGFDFLRASALAKFVNFSTNLSALSYFAFTGNIIFYAALPMALFNVLGAVIGAKLAIAKGNTFVRILFLSVVSAVIIKFTYDLIR